MIRSFAVAHVVLLLSAGAAPLVAQAEIASISFDFVPPDTALLGSEITLGGPTVVEGPLELGAGSSIQFQPERAGSIRLGVGDFGLSLVVGPVCLATQSGYLESPQECASNLFAGVAPVHVPIGATLTDFRCWYYDNEPAFDFIGNTGVTLFAIGDADLYPTELLRTDNLVTADALDVRREVSDSTFTPVEIQSDAHYYVRFFWQTTGVQTAIGSFRFYGCKIDYTISTWRP